MRFHCRKALNRRSASRCGYALVVVLLFNVLFLMLLGVAWRRMGSAIRIATASTQQSQHDEGSLRALAAAMKLLETGLPPESPYERGTIITLATTAEERFFRVRFQRDDTLPPEQRKYWAVTVTRTDTRPTDLLPSHFQTASP
jgi:hypothetical protein